MSTPTLYPHDILIHCFFSPVSELINDAAIHLQHLPVDEAAILRNQKIHHCGNIIGGSQPAGRIGFQQPLEARRRGVRIDIGKRARRYNIGGDALAPKTLLTAFWSCPKARVSTR